VAVGRSILIIVWHLLSDPTARFQDLGAGLLRHPQRRRARQAQPLRQLEALGDKVTLQPAT
jgi:transposase